MLISFAADAYDKNPQQLDLSWDEFRELLSTHEVRSRDGDAEKKLCPVFCPARLRPGGKANKDCEALTLAVLDVDKATEEEVARVMQASEPYEFQAYTTWKHTIPDPDKPVGINRLRLVFPLKREVLSAEWARFWPRMVSHLGGVADPKCKNPARIYFLPSCPEERKQHAETHHNAGNWLDPDAILLISAAPKPETAIAEKLTPEHLQSLERALRRRGTAHALLCAKSLKLIRSGLPFAPSGSRDETLFKLTGEIDRAYPNADPESLAELLAPSLSHMVHEDGAPDSGLVVSKLLRAKETRQAMEGAKEETQGSDLRTRILEAFRGQRGTPYTEAEIRTIATDLGIPYEQFHYHWIYQKGNSYYVRVLNDLRGPKMAIELSKVATTDLAPAVTLGVDPYVPNEKGIMVPKSPGQLVEQYGTRVDKIIASFVAQKSYYDQLSGTLIEAACPLRDLEPAYSESVDTWLRIFAGPTYEKLLDWLTLCPDLEQPLPAIYLEGAKGTGKTLLAEGVARLWSKSATPMEAIARSFNSLLSECPLIFADEYIPSEFRGDKGTGRLRALIAERQRTLSRKFVPDGSLEGCIRLIIAGNNDSLIQSDEHLTDNDIKAIIDRILYIRVSDHAAEYLKALPDIGSSFLREDKIAKHVWWLVANRSVEVRSRFGIEIEAGHLHRIMTISAGPRSVVCNWLVGALLNWDQVTRGVAGQGLKVVEGQLWVNSRQIVHGWDAVKTNAKAPSTRNLGMAITALSEASRQRRGLQMFRVIKTENLITWAEETDYASEEQIREALAKAERRQDADPIPQSN